MREQVVQLLPKREGHFVFESGHHGQVWLDLELLFIRPERVQPLAEALADRQERRRQASLDSDAGGRHADTGHESARDTPANGAAKS